MKKRLFIAGVLVFLLNVSLIADNERPVVLISSLVIKGLSAGETQLIENLIYSYANTLGEVLTPGEFSKDAEFVRFPLDAPVPDYTFSGTITPDEDGHILVIEIGRPGTGEKNSFTSIHKSTGELILRVRSIVESAFSGRNTAIVRAVNPGEPEKGPAARTGGEPLSEERITGIWQGDPGIEIVRLQRGGQGIAVFSSGARMHLSYSIEHNTLKVIQDSPNTERYYQRLGTSPVTVPYTVARRLSQEAEPMRWEFFLEKNGTVLQGTKTATGVRYELETILEIIPGVVREVQWVRAGH
jgi:hypothetical protein